MPDMMNAGVSGLLAMQRALDITSHNIANAQTPGYSRQRVELAATQPVSSGDGFVGRGVAVTTIQRAYDDLIASQQQSASSSYSRLDTFATRAQTLSNLFADSTTGLSASLQKFTNALQGVSNAPTSTAARQVLLSEADGLRQRLQTYDNRLSEIGTEVNASIKSEATTISNLSAGIAQLNQQIVNAQNSIGQPPNDLLDARDQKITELARHVSVSVTKQSDGSANVFIGKGQPLVLGANGASIVATADRYDPTRMTLSYQAGNTSNDLGDTLSGGSLGGLLDFRNTLLEPSRNQIGQIAVGLTTAVNAQHREGMDLSGNLGGDLFGIGPARVLTSSANAGASTVAAVRTSASALTSADYILQYTGSAWTLQRADTGAAVTMSGAGTALSPFTADGLSLVVSGTPVTGDSFKVQPTATAVAGLSVLITDVSKVAAAAPIRTGVVTGNSGTAKISAGEVIDVTVPQLRDPVTLTFIDATHYSINGVGSNLVGAGSSIYYNGWKVSFTGTPTAGDAFTVSSNTGGVGDNRNALAISAALNTGLLSGGTESLPGSVTRVVGAVGVATSQAQNGRDAQKLILDQTNSEKDGISGVNLDEEASNMMRYQQAYQASAQIIKMTQTLFETLLQATGR
jgi:flagellar hook-associated protein 1 FlgK